MEKSDSEIFRSCQPVWNTHVVTIFWGDNLAIIFNGSNFSSAHLAKRRGLLFIPHSQQNRQNSQLFKTIGIGDRLLLRGHSNHLCPFPHNAEVTHENAWPTFIHHYVPTIYKLSQITQHNNDRMPLPHARPWEERPPPWSMWDIPPPWSLPSTRALWRQEEC